MRNEFDAIILGAGIYGFYAANRLRELGSKVAVLEVDPGPFQRASYINQARIHNGYHYPRSYSTAVKSAHYFERFNRDFAFAIHKSFKKIYSISKQFSWVSGNQFETFCGNVKIPILRIDPQLYFNPHTIEAAFETQEYSFDAHKIRDWFIQKFAEAPSVQLYFGRRPQSVDIQGERYVVQLDGNDSVAAPVVLNATNASTNQVLDLFGFDLFKIKYEICEVIRCAVSPDLRDIGITVMDGPFFSLMPFGTSEDHSLTSVTYTPHKSSQEQLPTFSCQARNKRCTPAGLENCNSCPARPETAWKYMVQLAQKYLKASIKLDYRESLFAIKPIPSASEIDDSRPTIIKVLSKNPFFASVLSGKINTIYDLDQILI